MDKINIQHIAHLAKLKVTNEEVEVYSQQLSKILSHFFELSKLNTENIEPLMTPSLIEFSPREDLVQQECSVEELMESAPSKIGHLYKVPPVV
jgi:aspartyl-tRNA(Asn)/glutamyl-tRNA(Gln) amidotransferase subunit C